MGLSYSCQHCAMFEGPLLLYGNISSTLLNVSLTNKLIITIKRHQQRPRRAAAASIALLIQNCLHHLLLLLQNLYCVCFKKCGIMFLVITSIGNSYYELSNIRCNLLVSNRHLLLSTTKIQNYHFNC